MSKSIAKTLLDGFGLGSEKIALNEFEKPTTSKISGTSHFDIASELTVIPNDSTGITWLEQISKIKILSMSKPNCSGEKQTVSETESLEAIVIGNCANGVENAVLFLTKTSLIICGEDLRFLIVRLRQLRLPNVVVSILNTSKLS